MTETSKSRARLSRMHPAEALAALAADHRLGLVVDRRELGGGRLKLPQMEIRAHIDLENANANVNAYVVASAKGINLPLSLSDRSSVTHCRVLDRFFVPVTRDPLVTTAMFDLISELYERLADIPINVACAKSLLGEVLLDRKARATILDFGCGTGLAVAALGQTRKVATLIGTDLSSRMLEHAKVRGESVVTIDEWRQSNQRFDGAIACFVLHYGVSEGDLLHIAASLEPSARFAVNFFKAEDRDIAWLVTVLTQADMRLRYRFELPSKTKGANPALVFEKIAHG